MTPMGGRLGEYGVAVVGCLALAVVVAGLRLTWRVGDALPATDLTVYGAVPDDGMATRAILRTPQGELTQGTNARRLSETELTTTWPIEARVAWRGLAAGADVAFETVTTTTRAQAPPTRRQVFGAAGPAGLHVLATTLDGSPTVHAFDPPLLALPPALPAGATWTTQGQFGLGGRYRFSGEVRAHEPFTGPLGTFADCVTVVERLEIGLEPDAMQTREERSHSCRGVGEVARRGAEDGSALDLLATTRLPGLRVPSGAQNDAPAMPAAAPQGTADTWVLSAVGAVSGSRVASEPLFAPAVVTGSRVVAARAGGPLVAVDASAESTGATWRFHPANNVGGALDVSGDGALAVLGTTGKTVYGLTADGVLRWSDRARDAITGVVADDAGGAVYTSEDRTAVRISAQGERLWQITTGGPVSSRPALAAGRVVVAGEDGAVRLVDDASGQVVHRLDLGAAVAADITAADGVAYVATRSGRLLAVDITTAAERWQVDVRAEIVDAPAVVGDAVAVVAGGRYRAYDTAGGALRARSHARHYSGTPLATAEGAVVATTEGTIELLGGDGTVRRSWGPVAAGVGFREGPVAGLGAVWAIDTRGTLHRLGPARDQDAPAVSARWTRDLGDPALLGAGAVPAYPAVAGPDGEILLLEFGGGVLRADADTGTLRLLGRVPGVEDPAGGVLVSDGVLVVGTRNSLHAVTYPGLQPLWDRQGLGGSAGAPVVDGRTVYWATAALSDGGVLADAHLLAVDLHSGTMRWESPAAPAIVAAGVAVAGDIVVAGHGPTAYDAETGRVRWSLQARGAGLGRPAISPDGAQVAVGVLDIAGPAGANVLIAEIDSGRVTATLDLPRGSAVDASDAVRWDELGITVPQLDGGIATYEHDGEPRWSWSGTVPRFGDVGHAGGQLWFELVDSRVVVLDARDGAVVARDVVADDQLDVNTATARPVAVGDTVVVADGDTIRAYPAPVARR